MEVETRAECESVYNSNVLVEMRVIHLLCELIEIADLATGNVTLRVALPRQL